MSNHDYMLTVEQLRASETKHQKDVRKEARRQCRIANQTGGTVPYSLGYLLDLKLSLNVIRKIYRGEA